MNKKQLLKAIERNSFIALRTYAGNTIGINCKIKNTKRINDTKSIKGHSSFISFKPISFMEYISLKVPFM